MNFEEINNILRTKFESVDVLSDISPSEYPKELGEAKKIFQKGGEGEGSEYFTVIYFKEHNIYLRIDGYYSSYHGVDYGPWEQAVSEVTPQEKTITVYE